MEDQSEVNGRTSYGGADDSLSVVCGAGCWRHPRRVAVEMMGVTPMRTRIAQDLNFSKVSSSID